ncbi:lactonase family protein [Planctomyces sp. SH-PL62]|uniref:lactonase family protein n=1 Tax=Planctomyces sp. SH-PL62 TaxID=1636152 RepID=UPI00078ED714|nr:lactonase family protein [Planctomyces sp. SH-PL62]AMV40693.1 6-phosphogluconolactonase [Planctomyces sp. SH-PL62]
MTMGMGSTSRRAFASACGFLALTAGGILMQTQAVAAEKSWVYVGTYTNSKESPSEGIYRFEFDPADGSLAPKGVAAEFADPSFLAVHPSKKFLYAVGELGEFQGAKAGGVGAFSLDAATGELKPINQQSSGGAHPCHLTVDPTGKAVLVANYSGGSVACLPIEADGSLRPASSFIQHQGKSVDPGRQTAPHAHSVNLDPAGKIALVADLGLDKVLLYDLDAAAGKLTPHDPAFAEVAAGSGPRHLAWHPSGRFAYVITELKNTVDVFAYDKAKGALHEVQTISTLPDDFQGASYCAEVVAHPSGKFVYGSNRGHDSLAIYKVDPATGKLASAGWAPTGGKNPRNFAIDPTGGFLLAASQDSDRIVVFRIDPETGGLTPVGEPIAVPKPVCIRFVTQPSSAK